MSKIVFLSEPNTVYDGKFAQIGTNQVRLIFTDNMPSEEVLTSGFNLVNEHNGRVQTKREDYIYVYRTYEDIPNQIELCNNNNPWVAPKFTVRFVSDFNEVLEGELSQDVYNYEDLVIPTVVAGIGYELKGWTPEIPSEGKLEKNITFYANIVDKNVYFHSSGGGTLEGELKQTVNNYSELEIPKIVADDNYNFVGWMPEIPTEGTIDENNINFYAVFENVTSDRLNALESDLTDTQLGLVENYDFALATAEEVTDLQLALVEIYNLIMGGN